MGQIGEFSSLGNDPSVGQIGSAYPGQTFLEQSDGRLLGVLVAVNMPGNPSSCMDRFCWGAT